MTLKIKSAVFCRDIIIAAVFVKVAQLEMMNCSYNIALISGSF